MKRMMKLMRVDLDVELKTLEEKRQRLLIMRRTVAKFGVRSRPKMMMMEAERNGLKVIHRINIFEEIIFFL